MRPMVAVVAISVLLAGCGGGGGGGPVQLSADAATIAQDTLDATGFESQGQSASWVNTTISVSISGDVELQASKDVRARSPVRTYRRGSEAGPIAVGLLTVPAVHLLEESADIIRNPASEIEPGSLAGRVQSSYGAIEIGEQIDNTTVTMLGNRTHLVTYAATAPADGQTREVRVSIATVQHGDAFVTYVEVSPASTANIERTQQLLAGVEH